MNRKALSETLLAGHASDLADVLGRKICVEAATRFVWLAYVRCQSLAPRSFAFGAADVERLPVGSVVADSLLVRGRVSAPLADRHRPGLPQAVRLLID